jgi:hypothetical protein
MDDRAKVRLSKEEITLVSDPDWILTKNSIMVRAVDLFAGLSEAMSGELRALSGQLQAASHKLQDGTVSSLPPNAFTPKISKGENYLGLPYVMLDHPRLFGKEDVLAIRTMFWWGHYFSVTLHLKGQYKNLLLPVIRVHLGELVDAGFHIAVSEDEWRHEVEEGNYRPLAEATSGELRAVRKAGEAAIDMAEHPFIKLSAKCGLDKWNEAPEILMDLFRVLLHALSV